MEIVPVIAVLLFLFLVLYLVIFRFGRKIPAAAKRRVREQWARITRESDYKHAILDADKLLDYALTRHGYSGPLGGKLKEAGKGVFTNLNGVWGAHKTRNRIAHEIDFRVNEKMYRECMSAFKGALQDLKML